MSVIATGSPGRRNGLTATSICALSVAPPMLIACVNRRASAHDAITDNGFFSVNVLSAGDQRVATIFSAGSGAREKPASSITAGPRALQVRRSGRAPSVTSNADWRI